MSSGVSCPDTTLFLLEKRDGTLPGPGASESTRVRVGFWQGGAGGCRICLWLGWDWVAWKRLQARGVFHV